MDRPADAPSRGAPSLLRATVFNILFYFNLIAWLIVCLPAMALPRRHVRGLLPAWARSAVWLTRVVGGIDMQVRGPAHIRRGPLIVAAKHQSMFETFALLMFCADGAYILKRELSWIPLFGWWILKFRLIPVRRGGGPAARADMIAHARAAFAEGRQIIIFPEGTRRPPGAAPDYRSGVAHLYEAGGVACQPVALNSGVYWPRRRWMRYPGTIVFEFLDEIPPGLDRAAFMARLERDIETASDRLLAESRRVAGEGAAQVARRTNPEQTR